MILGGGVRYSEAGGAFLRFAEAFRIPFGETQAGKSGVPGSHSLNLGGVGVTGNAAANLLASKADLIIGVGTRFTDFTTGSKGLFQEADVLTINISDFHAGKLDAVKVVADAKAGLEAIASGLGNYLSSYQDEIEGARGEWKQNFTASTRSIQVIHSHLKSPDSLTGASSLQRIIEDESGSNRGHRGRQPSR